MRKIGIIRGVLARARRVESNPDSPFVDDNKWYRGKMVCVPTVGVRFMLYPSISTNIVTEVTETHFRTMSGSLYEWEVLEIKDFKYEEVEL